MCHDFPRMKSPTDMFSHGSFLKTSLKKNTPSAGNHIRGNTYPREIHPWEISSVGNFIRGQRHTYLYSFRSDSTGFANAALTL